MTAPDPVVAKPPSWLIVTGEDGSKMTWPHPHDPTQLERRLRYAPDSITRGDQMALASLVHAYGHLMALDSRTRQLRVMQVRRTIEEQMS